jgi:hypothetical protein
LLFSEHWLTVWANYCAKCTVSKMLIKMWLHLQGALSLRDLKRSWRTQHEIDWFDHEKSSKASCQEMSTSTCSSMKPPNGTDLSWTQIIFNGVLISPLLKNRESTSFTWCQKWAFYIYINIIYIIYINIIYILYIYSLYIPFLMYSLYILWAWCHEILTLRKLRQEDHKFKGSLSYKARPCLNR